MLYIWPFMLFFSWPLAYPWILGALIPVVRLPSTLKPYTINFPLSFGRISSLLSVMAVLALVLGVVHFNTIIHPFTLADNRHYVFYVFRILRLHPCLFYAAAPVYVASAWAVLQTLCRPKPSGSPHVGEETRDEKGTGSVVRESSDTLRNRKKSTSRRVAKASNRQGSNDVHPIEESDDDEAVLEPTRTSWVIVWLATCTLCLVTAPLVEPRYFILPWLLWRLEVPSQAPELTSAVSNRLVAPQARVDQQEQREDGPLQQHVVERLSSGLVILNTRRIADWLKDAAQLLHDASDHRLWLETAWFVVVNMVTCYVFLYRPFESANEWEKTESRRFMW